MTAPRFTAFIAVVVLAVAPTAVPAYPPFVIDSRQLTWREEAANCKILVFGKLDKARQEGKNFQTDLLVEYAFETEGYLKMTKRVTIDRYLPMPDAKNPPTFLLFGDMDPKDCTPDYFRGAFVSSAVVEYLKGLLSLKDKPRAEQLRFCFAYLEHADKEIAADASAEFALATTADLDAVGPKLSAKVLRTLLSNEKTPPRHIGLYARLLCYCGGKDDAKLVRGLLEKYAKDDNPTTVFNDLYQAYALLNPSEGWSYAHAVAKDSAKSFVQRYAVLRAATFFLTEKKGVVEKKALLETFSVLLDQADIVDLVIERLRKARCWAFTAHILTLPAKKGFESRVTREAVLRYAFQCPDKSGAKYVAECRKTNPDSVEDAEELLKWEGDPKPKEQ